MENVDSKEDPFIQIVRTHQYNKFNSNFEVRHPPVVLVNSQN
jgi:hypothetical protein